MADLKIGDAAPAFSLPGIDDKTHTLAEYNEGKVFVVFFTSNHCTTSHGAAARLKSFLADYRGKGMTFVAIKQPVPVEITKPHGCSTKWDKTPVDVEPIDVAAAAALRKNGTNKVRLINVWATWCGPCVAEFPELCSAARQYDMRDFEFISISVDDPKDTAKVKAFLEKNSAGMSPSLQKTVVAEGRKTNSYVFTGTDTEQLMRALDPEWKGGVPHTLLVGTDGQVVWHNNGDELRSKILVHLGNYYQQ